MWVPLGSGVMAPLDPGLPEARLEPAPGDGGVMPIFGAGLACLAQEVDSGWFLSGSSRPQSN